MRNVLCILVTLSVVLLVGCDPAKEVLDEGQSFNPRNYSGVIVGKGVSFFIGDREHTKSKKGNPYNWIIIRPKNSTEEQKIMGISDFMFANLYIWDYLPKTPVLSRADLSKLAGSVVGKWCNLEKKLFLIAVKELKDIKIYSISRILYYEEIAIGTPLSQLKEETK